jgi:hypothetical protein
LERRHPHCVTGGNRHLSIGAHVSVADQRTQQQSARLVWVTLIVEGCGRRKQVTHLSGARGEFTERYDVGRR